MDFVQIIVTFVVAVIGYSAAYLLLPSQRKKNLSSEALDRAHVTELVEEQYAKLLILKDNRIAILEVKVGLLEVQMGAYRKEINLYKQYINYLLKGITEDKQATFVPIGLDAFEAAQVAPLEA